MFVKLNGFKYLLLSCCLLMLQGCSLFAVKTPEIKTYTFATKPATNTLSSSHKERVLRISTPTASPGYETSNMLYMKKPYELDHFGYNAWAAPPSDMLLPLLVESIENTHCFDAVVTAPVTNTASMNLQTNITVLQQEFLGDKSCVRLNVSATLSDDASGFVTQRRFEVVVPTDGNNPYAGVVAANKAVGMILRKVNHFVCKAE